ncbi:hypothetical protein Athai_67260 [Actinocatenispora thailandica]|uniref:Uncharacterized protein n=1 Tax=Actinocatenispora thailandica TaxID=227318 RepID=A0A7R7DWL5_9ACTN|nr:hypothetical protein Athai_67260 [Actinocatenispora thailandica]
MTAAIARRERRRGGSAGGFDVDAGGVSETGVGAGEGLVGELVVAGAGGAPIVGRCTVVGAGDCPEFG